MNDISRTEQSGGIALDVRNLRVDLRSNRGNSRSAILDDISLTIGTGECLAIVGESGAGKSVLTRTLLGLTQSDTRWRVSASRFMVTGVDVRRTRERQWRALRGSAVSFVLQDALQSLDPLRTIAAEVGESLTIRGIRGAARRERVLQALQNAGLPQPAVRAEQRSGQLSGGMRQRALIASALIGNPQLLIADEPTTALDPTTATVILDEFRAITSRGTALLLVSHDLESVASVADRIAVMDQGRIVELGTTAELLSHPKHPVTQKLLASIPSGPKPGPSAQPGAELLELRGVHRSFSTRKSEVAALIDVDLTLRRGEAIGVVGESGAGKTTLARVLVGAEVIDAGVIERRDPACRLRLIPQDPLATFDPRWRVDRILAASNRLPDTTVADLLRLVGLDPTLASRRPITLSGGQRQRVAIARAIAADPDVLVCDEPVSALDVTTQAGVLDLLRNLQRDRGLTVVFVSHDIAAVRAVCERLVIMQDGRVVESGSTEAVFADPQTDFTRRLLGTARAIPR